MKQRSLRHLPAPGLLAVALAMACLPAHALYKVVGPDGKITYTDRADTAAAGNRITTINPDTGSAAASALPFELRQLVSRYPVTLYVGSSCQPCDLGRAYLNQRGIPYSEKQILNNDDSEALEKLTGGREAPTLTIGSQVLRGFSPEVWASYLDAAGYPKESRLPPSYQAPVPAPLVSRRSGSPPVTDLQQRLEQSSEGIPVAPPAPAPAPGGIRF